MSKPWSFVEHVTRQLAAERFGDPKIPTFWPSEGSAVVQTDLGPQVVGHCRRATFFRYLNDLNKFNGGSNPVAKEVLAAVNKVKAETDTYLRWIWVNGSLYEDYLIGQAKESGVFIGTQVPITINRGPYVISGKLDLIAINPDDGNYAIVESKSVYSFGGVEAIGTFKREGKPKDSNLIQIALYDWHYAKKRKDFSSSRLVYGDRGNGEFAEYMIDATDQDIRYTQISPYLRKPKISPITIRSIIEQYDYVYNHIVSMKIPPRDFDIQYSDEKIEFLHKHGLLTKSESKRVARRLEQIKDGKKKINMQIKKGDFQCRYCEHAAYCYSKTDIESANEKEDIEDEEE